MGGASPVKIDLFGWKKEGRKLSIAGVNLTNILRAAFVPIFFRQKNTKPNCKYKKAAHNTFEWKSRS